MQFSLTGFCGVRTEAAPEFSKMLDKFPLAARGFHRQTDGVVQVFLIELPQYPLHVGK